MVGLAALLVRGVRLQADWTRATSQPAETGRDESEWGRIGLKPDATCDRRMASYARQGTDVMAGAQPGLTDRR